jgi:DNA-binding CsgD family transcriptional regulator
MGNTKDFRESRNHRSLSNDLVTLWPGIPYLGLGLWLSWAFLAYSGTFWLSDIETNGNSLAMMYLLSTASNAFVLLISPLLSYQFERVLASRSGILGAGLLTALGSLGIILAGPYYLAQPFLFHASAVATGAGTAILTLRCGQLYSGLQPWRALIYTLLSHLLVVIVFFFVLGNERFRPIAGGPSLGGIVALTLLPILVSFLFAVKTVRQNASESEQENAQYQRNIHLLSPAFWKFLLAILVFTMATSVVGGLFTSLNPPSAILDNTSTVMLLRAFFIAALLLLTIRFFRHLNFGKPYLLFVTAIAIIVALLPLLQIYTAAFANIINFSSSIFDLLVWCLLSFIAFEKHILPTIVFGFGRGAFMAGSTIGWLIGVKVMPRLAGTTQEMIIYISLAFLILIAATLVFSGKDFDRLFTPIPEMELDLDDVFLESTGELSRSEKPSDRERPYITACRNVGNLARLSTREQDILELLAMGRGNENIAKRLNISLNTVRTHTQKVYTKLDVHSRQELIELVEAERNQLSPSPVDGE